MIYYKQQKYTNNAAVSFALARKHWPLSAALHERPPLKTKGRVYTALGRRKDTTQERIKRFTNICLPMKAAFYYISKSLSERLLPSDYRSILYSVCIAMFGFSAFPSIPIHLFRNKSPLNIHITRI